MKIDSFLAWFYWDPEKIAFEVPFIEHPVAWYGLLFVLGFFLSYLIICQMFQRFLSQTNNPFKQMSDKEAGTFLTDRLTWFVVAGTIIGARLGYVFFYDLQLLSSPLEILKTWHGGLASHGGVLGIIASLCLFKLSVRKEMPNLSLITLMDFVALPSALVSFFIRLGNFVNQEILGTETALPWGVVFGHPADGSRPLPRHPVQLYEGLAYLAIFLFLSHIWYRRDAILYPGRLCGWLFILVFSSRFILEFWKVNQDSVLDLSTLQMGQILSLPLIGLGACLLANSYRSTQTKPNSLNLNPKSLKNH